MPTPSPPPSCLPRPPPGPQAFYNLNPNGDIFNHANVHFWDYTQASFTAVDLA